MGMESYHLDLIPKNVTVTLVDDIRKYKGISNLNLSDFINKFKRIPLSIELNQENILFIDKALQLQINVADKKVQSIIIQGCFTWFEEGLELCYNVVNFINNNIIKIDLSILGENYEVEDLDLFKTTVIECYKDKYEYFRTYLADFKVKVLPSNFYKYRKKYLRKKRGIFYKFFNGSLLWKNFAKRDECEWLCETKISCDRYIPGYKYESYAKSFL